VRKFILLMCLLWMGFIFYMSSNTGQVSHQKSIKIADFIEKKDTQTKTESNTKSQATSKAEKIKKNRLDNFIRKNAHAFEYIVLAVLISSAFFSYNKKRKDAVIYILFIALFYAVTDEFHQSFVPGRGSLVSDVLIDFSGAVIGVCIFYLVVKIMNRKKVIKL
jgi:VanZ family protein